VVTIIFVLRATKRYGACHSVSAETSKKCGVVLMSKDFGQGSNLR